MGEATRPGADAGPVERPGLGELGHDRRPAALATVQEMVADVNRIIATLKETLDDMEGVLEALELAERQQTADENEMESLRRALRQLQRPRDGGQAAQRGPQD